MILIILARIAPEKERFCWGQFWKKNTREENQWMMSWIVLKRTFLKMIRSLNECSDVFGKNVRFERNNGTRFKWKKAIGYKQYRKPFKVFVAEPMLVASGGEWLQPAIALPSSSVGQEPADSADKKVLPSKLSKASRQAETIWVICEMFHRRYSLLTRNQVVNLPKSRLVYLVIHHCWPTAHYHSPSSSSPSLMFSSIAYYCGWLAIHQRPP